MLCFLHIGLLFNGVLLNAFLLRKLFTRNFFGYLCCAYWFGSYFGLFVS